MNTIQIANLLLTRRCNLHCDYCRIIKDIPEVPEYPTMNYYSKNELTYLEWCSIIARLKANNENVFLVIYGGEPFLYKDLDKILIFCHSLNVNYTVISNNTLAIRPRIIEVFDKTGPFKGFSSSVDPIIMAEGETWKDVRSKSLFGLNRLNEMKKDGIIIDAVAEITVLKSTLKYLYDLISVLTDYGIYSSITTLDLQKTSYYDFSTVVDESELVPKNQETRDMFDKILADKNLLIHIPSLLNKIYDSLPCNMKCNLNKDLHNVTIDSDGTARLCLRIRGTNTPSSFVKFGDLVTVDGKVTKDYIDGIFKDYDKYCQGCIWTCPMISEYPFEQILNH